MLNLLFFKHQTGYQHRIQELIGQFPSMNKKKCPPGHKLSQIQHKNVFLKTFAVRNWLNIDTYLIKMTKIYSLI